MFWAPVPVYLHLQGQGRGNPLAATAGFQTGYVPRAEVIPDFLLVYFNKKCDKKTSTLFILKVSAYNGRSFSILWSLGLS